jgi:hypothetical protein
VLHLSLDIQSQRQGKESSLKYVSLLSKILDTLWNTFYTTHLCPGVTFQILGTAPQVAAPEVSYKDIPGPSLNYVNQFLKIFDSLFFTFNTFNHTIFCPGATSGQTTLLPSLQIDN